MTTIDPSEKHYELDPEVTRVLKRGDLTRINSNTPGKLMDHNGDLARVVKATEVGPTLENSHPFVYDLELVLGGKLHDVFRASLLYTTASQEGMIGDSRIRRKRKPNSLFETEAAEAEEAKKAKGKGGKKKKAAAPTTTTTTTNAKKGKAGAAAAKTNAPKKRPAEEKGKGSSKKAKPSAPENNAVSSNTPAAGQALDLFERHRKEFERSLGRLEKADAYNFFGTVVPPEFEESYTKPNKSQESSDSPQQPSNSSQQHNGLATSSQSPFMGGVGNDKKSKKKKKDDDEESSDENSVYFPSTPAFNLVVIRRRMELGRYILDRVRIENEERIDLLTPYWKSIGRKNINRRPKKSLIPVLHPKGIDWDLFRKDVHEMCDAAVERNKDLDDVGPGTLGHAAGKIKDLMEHLYEKNGRRHNFEMTAANDRHRFSLAMDQKANTEAAMQGKWKRDAFPERKYERLRGDVVCAGLSALDEKIAAYELKTTLEDRFIGVAYKYDDTGQSEGWMKSVLDVTGEQNQRQEAARALASDEGAIKAQVNACMQSLLIGVLDKVMTDSGVLQQNELRCANWENDTDIVPDMEVSSNSEDRTIGPEFVVQEVWGIDCYTRRNITICLETEFDSDTVQTFREKWLLPAINACPADLAHDISNSCLLLEGLPFDVSTSLHNDKGTAYEQWKNTVLGKALLKKISTYGPPWLTAAAQLLRRAKNNLGPDFFRIHPKGHGSIVLSDKLQPNRLVTFYRGEVYPSWRWGEKTDAIAKIQEQKGLKPVLPDFFNMALERPQHDPRGYGLLFVDATRKSNYGSMLSHSCQPSCEVHVVAVNGELRLAITTIREMTIGDELTFDYNAVTESLFEYQSAVCLCGHGRCSGSFLHFAAADCYQQVLNRNSPVASRLANLIKGCTKKVMSDEDDRILKRHGFQTAAFGAVSVNRRNASALDKLDTTLDSMDIVPVWLRTYVADTLRYIEYERRALPIALICNDLYDETGNVPAESESNDEESSPGEVESSGDSDGEESSEEEVEKPVKRSRPEPTFFFYARTQREYFTSLLADDDDKTTVTGAELKREIQKLASAHWKSLDADDKETWKAKALEDWKKTGGGIASLEEDKKPKAKNKNKEKKPRKNKLDSKNKVGKDAKSNKKPNISFQEADAEGVSAMEQRIQQLTQTLSRVGRVLDRHREATLRSRNGSDRTISDESLREVTHSPLEIMPDEHVVAWMWNHSEGIVRTLVRCTENDICVSPELRKSILDTVSKHAILEQFGTPWANQAEDGFPMSPSEGRERLNEALLELRKDLLDGIQQMASVIKKHKSKSRLVARKKERNDELARQSPEKIPIRSTVKSILQELVATVEARLARATSIENGDSVLATLASLGQEQVVDDKADVTDDADSDLDPWLRNFNKRFKIEKAADLLLLYAKTGYFFSIKGYRPLKSSPIEVYARDLGNAVPASTVDHELLPEPESFASSPAQSPNLDTANEKAESMSVEESGATFTSTKKSKELCDPEDIVSNVVVEYQGDYVLSQLLQWYNAGIGQKPGLPDSLGCIMLPSMNGCWKLDGTTVSNSFTDRATKYQSTTRRRLIEWLKDPLMRGNPWPDDVRKAFVDKEEGSSVADAASKWLPLGSPILDFLVTGDDHNMNSVMTILSSFHSSSARSGSAVGDGLMSTVDEGRPAEAVSNWVQCENPACQKWRKVPWNVDIDMLPEQFYCKDNLWNPKSASCDAPEDEWDQTTDAQVGVDGSQTIHHESSLDTSKIRSAESAVSFKLCDFQLGARFDIRRAGKKSWAIGKVVNLDLAGDPKRIKVHYPKMQIKYDEWIEIDSPRIAPLHSHVPHRPKKENSDSGNQTKGTKKSKSKDNKRVKAKKTAKKQKQDSSAISRPNEISDDPSFERTEKTHVIHTDDSSMADVFLQDSDDDDDETPSSKKVSKPILPKRTSLQDSEEEDSFGSAASESGGDALEDSEDDGEDLQPPKGPMVAVTDESSPDEAKKSSEKSNEASSVWTIPKKKSSPVKRSLLPTAPQAPDDNLLLAPGGDKSNSVTRIPRKKLAAPVSQPQSLLLTEPRLGSVPAKDTATKNSGSFSAPLALESVKQSAKDEASSPDARSQGPSRGNYPRDESSLRNDRLPYVHNDSGMQSARHEASSPDAKSQGPSRGGYPRDESLRNDRPPYVHNESGKHSARYEAPSRGSYPRDEESLRSDRPSLVHNDSGKQSARYEGSSPDARSQGPSRGNYPRDESLRNDRPPYVHNDGGKQSARYEASSPDAKSQGPGRSEYARNERPRYNENTGYREGNSHTSRDHAGKPAGAFHSSHEKVASQDDPERSRFWPNRPSHSDADQYSPNHRDFHGRQDGGRSERERVVPHNAGYEESSSPVRERRHHGDAPNGYRSRDRDFYDGGSSRRHDQYSPNRNGRYESFAPEGDYQNRAGNQEWAGHRSDRPAGNYNEDRYSHNHSGNAGDYTDRRYDRQNEAYYTAQFGDDERAGRQWRRDRGDEASSRRHEQTPDDRGYNDRHGGRYEEAGEYDDYQYQRRYDRNDGYKYDRYDESPRRKHGSRRSADRERSRDRHRRSGDERSSERRRRRSEGRSSQREEGSPGQVFGTDLPARMGGVEDTFTKGNSSRSLNFLEESRK